MSFFVMPAWEPPSGYRIPAWLRPPETMVPGIVPVELLLGRTDTDATLVTDLRVYPTGLEFALTVRPRPDLPDRTTTTPIGPPWPCATTIFRRLGLIGGQGDGEGQQGQDGDGQQPTGKAGERFKVACGCQPPRSF